MLHSPLTTHPLHHTHRSEVIDVIRFATAVRRPPRRYSLDRLASAHGANRSAVERTWRRARPSHWRAVTAVFLCSRFHQPLAARIEDLRARGLWGSRGS